jgi:hypothetical protein
MLTVEALGNSKCHMAKACGAVGIWEKDNWYGMGMEEACWERGGVEPMPSKDHMYRRERQASPASKKLILKVYPGFTPSPEHIV